jgi:hypothetical protein
MRADAGLPGPGAPRRRERDLLGRWEPGSLRYSWPCSDGLGCLGNATFLWWHRWTLDGMKLAELRRVSCRLLMPASLVGYSRRRLLAPKPLMLTARDIVPEPRSVEDLRPNPRPLTTRSSPSDHVVTKFDLAGPINVSLKRASSSAYCELLCRVSRQRFNIPPLLTLSLRLFRLSGLGAAFMLSPALAAHSTMISVPGSDDFFVCLGKKHRARERRTTPAQFET